MAEGRFVSYLRVSTDRQGRSGLGLEAQREAVTIYLNGGRWDLIAEFVEHETGKGSNALTRRPQLRAALALAKKQRATLVIAKLDRLSRNMAFTATLMDAGVDFIAVDNPHASRLTLHILAAVAEHEREMIAERTKAALAASKARGTVLGAHGKVLADQRKVEALERLAAVGDRLTALKAEGLTMRAIADRLNTEGLVSPAGGAWQSGNVHRALSRLAYRPRQSPL
jgi:DNA invertase Pin-like site-specific DNA recombinase